MGDIEGLTSEIVHSLSMSRDFLFNTVTMIPCMSDNKKRPGGSMEDREHFSRFSRGSTEGLKRELLASSDKFEVESKYLTEGNTIPNDNDLVELTIRFEFILRDVLQNLVNTGIINPELHEKIKHAISFEISGNKDGLPYYKIGTVLLEAFVEHMNLYAHLSASVLELHRNCKRKNLSNGDMICNLDDVMTEISSQTEEEIKADLERIEKTSGNGKLLTGDKECENLHFVELRGIQLHEYTRELKSRRKFAYEIIQKSDVRGTKGNILEQELRDEKLKRRSIQSKLIDTENESRKVIQEVESKNLELHRKIELLDVENTRLKLKHQSTIELELPPSEDIDGISNELYEDNEDFRC